jgi:Zn-dependent protease with chaperone function/ribosomal protein L40E
MRTKVLLVLFLFLVPAIAYVFGGFIRANYDAEWSALLVNQFGEKAQEINESFHFADFCSDPTQRDALAVQCSLHEAALFMRRSSVFAVLSGFLLFTAIGLAGYFARFSRRLLLYVFRPALYVTVMAAILLVLLHTSLATGSLYTINTYYLGSVLLMFLVVGVAIVGILGCIALIRSTISVFFPVTTKVFGKKLAADDQPELYATVRGLAAEIGVAPPDHIVVGFDANFFVTDSKLECHDRRLWGRTMYLSLPLCRILSREELLGIIGHELGHFKGLDTYFGRKFFPIYRLATECVSALETRAHGSSAIALYPAYYFLSFFLDSFSRAERKLHREQELAADRVGAGLVGEMVCGTALVKVHAFQDFWELFRQGLRDSLDAGQPFTNASRMFAEGVKGGWREGCFEGLEERETPHPTNTHPTLKVRLEALNLNVAKLIEAAAVVLPEAPAVHLIAGHEQIEEDLTSVKRGSMVKAREVVSEKICPACHRKNPFKAELCECGFNFLRMPTSV